MYWKFTFLSRLNYDFGLLLRNRGLNLESQRKKKNAFENASARNKISQTKQI